jgi:ABC-type Fe3+/spermidine/putrescine transport system ATPase subunit
MSTIGCQGITKSFGSTPVLDHLDLDVPDGAVVTVLGASGSGKTTLLRLIAGFERPDAGTISIDDELVDSPRLYVPPERRRIGYVAQEGNLFSHLTVAANVGFGLSRRERSSGRVARWEPGTLTSCRADSSNGWHSPERSPPIRRSCCWTNRSPPSTPACGRRCAST